MDTRQRVLIYRHFILLALFLMSGETVAQTIDFQLNTKSVLIAVQQPIHLKSKAKYNAKASLLYTEKHNHKDILIKTGASRDITNADLLNLSIGVNYIYSDVIDYETSGMALNLSARYNVTFLPKVFTHVSLEYAPSETSFIDSKAYIATNVKLGYRINETTVLHLNYHNIEFDVKEKNSLNLDEAVLVGFSLTRK